MTNVPHPAAVSRTPPHASIAGRPAPALLGNRSGLRGAVSANRAEIAMLEADWVAAAEADAAPDQDKGVRRDDRSTWNKAVWDRYLAAAEAMEPSFKPRIKRLLREIDHLERLLAMPETTTAIVS